MDDSARRFSIRYDGPGRVATLFGTGPGVASVGVHGWAGRWLVNGSAEGIVTMSIAPPCRARTAVFPLKIHTLRVSLTDPTGFAEAVHPN